MEEDLVAVRVWRNAGYVTVGFAAYPFRRMGLLKQLIITHRHTHTHGV